MVMVKVKVTDIYVIVTERNKNTMIDIKQIKALSMREAEITETLTFAKKELDKTGSAVFPLSCPLRRTKADTGTTGTNDEIERGLENQSSDFLDYPTKNCVA